MLTESRLVLLKDNISRKCRMCDEIFRQMNDRLQGKSQQSFIGSCVPYLPTESVLYSEIKTIFLKKNLLHLK